MSRIYTNVPSLIASHILGSNNTAMNTALERLSTGLRINKGKDDPAGLIASETLRGELKAINAAIENARRADNVIAVAEGALQEVSSLLVELEGLVDRTANEAALSDEEVKANQLQIDSILETLDRISTSTEFQGKKLLNGEFDYITSGLVTGPAANEISYLQINSARIPNGGSRSVVVNVTQSAQTAKLIYAGATTGAGSKTIQISGKYGTEQLTFASNTTAANVAAAVVACKALTGVSATVSGTGANTRILFHSTDYGSDAFVSVEAISGTFTVSQTNGGPAATKDVGQDVGANINGVAAVGKGLDLTIRTNGFSADMTLKASFATNTSSTKTFYVTGGGADFSIAPTLGVNATASLGIQSVSTGSLGKAGIGFLSSLKTGQANQLASGNFETAQRIIRAASEQVSALRGRMGAFQKNTLASAINALQIAYENTSAAESAIRDADFAAETSALTRAQILVQSTSRSLAMANAAPQNVLQLLG
ncbi:MAG TPA: flagellin [Phycisphaerae bacterium]|nr:flagellin [Phycisphaerae bacterium]HOJ72751.1 flagellin [Phycisphaerae bacterium]HOM51822.1 flagellin [Phycisphaerae bacterium]HON68952.1 flagellin [Phycisphaerae bacterium]HOQ84400.1 flagellin [Phycisphaerae bacterium]